MVGRAMLVVWEGDWDVVDGAAGSGTVSGELDRDCQSAEEAHGPGTVTISKHTVDLCINLEMLANTTKRAWGLSVSAPLIVRILWCRRCQQKPHPTFRLSTASNSNPGHL